MILMLDEDGLIIGHDRRMEVGIEMRNAESEIWWMSGM